MKCRECGDNVPRVDSGKRDSLNRRYWVDDSNRRWGGAGGVFCPNCPPPSSGQVNLDPLTNRKCRVCKKRLPTSRYFAHSYCVKVSELSPGQGYYGPDDWGCGLVGRY